MTLHNEVAQAPEVCAVTGTSGESSSLVYLGCQRDDVDQILAQELASGKKNLADEPSRLWNCRRPLQ